jgi:hypothetical protein
MHSLNTFGARTNHEQTQIHKTHHGPNLGEVTIFVATPLWANCEGEAHTPKSGNL